MSRKQPSAVKAHREKALNAIDNAFERGFVADVKKKERQKKAMPAPAGTDSVYGRAQQAYVWSRVPLPGSDDLYSPSQRIALAVTAVLVGLAVLMLVFAMGMAVGRRRASGPTPTPPGLFMVPR